MYSADPIQGGVPMSILDCTVMSAVLLWFIAAVRYCMKRKKPGRHACCGGCAGCPRRCTEDA